MQLKISITLILVLVAYTKTYSQVPDNFNSEYILLIKKSSPFTKVLYDKDSTAATFRIEVKGMETKEKRQEAIKKSRKNNRLVPLFYLTFIGSKVGKIYSLKCIEYITVAEYRKEGYDSPNSIIILQAVGDSTYIKWKAIFMPAM